MKTFREYLNECRFEDIWHSIVENFSESERIKPVYAEYFEKLKELPHKPVKGIMGQRRSSVAGLTEDDRQTVDKERQVGDPMQLRTEVLNL